MLSRRVLNRTLVYQINREEAPPGNDQKGLLEGKPTVQLNRTLGFPECSSSTVCESAREIEIDRESQSTQQEAICRNSKFESEQAWRIIANNRQKTSDFITPKMLHLETPK